MRRKLIVTNMTPEFSIVDMLLNTEMATLSLANMLAYCLKMQIKCFITKLWKEQLNEKHRYF